MNLFNLQIFQLTSDQYVTVRRDGSLHIERVQLDDAGDYTCLAENVIGATNHTTTVNVYGSVQNILRNQILIGTHMHKNKEKHNVWCGCHIIFMFSCPFSLVSTSHQLLTRPSCLIGKYFGTCFSFTSASGFVWQKLVKKL